MSTCLKFPLKVLFSLVFLLYELLALPFLVLFCLVCRFKKKNIDIGLGPEPLINNIYHKKALLKYGYSAETFVSDAYFITSEFDINFRKIINSLSDNDYIQKLLFKFSGLICFLLTVYRYRALYIYFNGGPLGIFPSSLWRLEPHLYRLAGVKVVVMPYGGDVQDLLRCPNLFYRHAVAKQYPEHRFRRNLIQKRVSMWTTFADHIISGCDWVYYMYYWDTLTLAHFSVDTDLIKPLVNVKENNETLKILHAPNHRYIKGTEFFVEAVEQLKKEGYAIELIILEKVPNAQIKEAIASVDIIADQLIIGWYAMFAIEAMAMGKPVICYLDSDLIQLYETAGLIEKEELPIINCTTANIKDKMKEYLNNRDLLEQIGRDSRDFVVKHHSLSAIGKKFDDINKSLKIAV